MIQTDSTPIRQPEVRNLYTDRSRQIAYQECPRRRWWLTEYKDRGIRLKNYPIYFLTGAAGHKGIETILGYAIRGEIPANIAEVAVEAALEYFDREFIRRGVQVAHGPEGEFAVAEQRALIEGLLRGWVLYRMPAFLAQYEVLCTEREQLVTLTTKPVPEDWVFTRLAPAAMMHILHQSRADAVLRDRATGDLYIFSLKIPKTTGRMNKTGEEEHNRDVQGLSELWAFEAHLEPIWKRVNELATEALGFDSLDVIPKGPFGFLVGLPTRPRIDGIQMEFLLKGARYESPKGSGRYRHSSPITRGWRQPGPTPDLDRYAWSYEWYGPEINPTTNRLVQHKLGKGWVPIDPWSDYPGGTKAWVEALYANQIQPEAGNALEPVFRSPVPYNRLMEDVVNWTDQTAHQEYQVAWATAQIREAKNDNERLNLLNRYFPQYRRSCDWPVICEFQQACFTPQVNADPIASGFYEWREPHHTPERESMGLVQLDVIEGDE